jgi:hypothetical protein
MVVFREDKTYDEEIKTWQLWHKRQHSPKQRILEVDTKNSNGIIGQIEEVSHNAVQFCWNPAENSSVQVIPLSLIKTLKTPKNVQFIDSTKITDNSLYKLYLTNKHTKKQPV